MKEQWEYGTTKNRGDREERRSRRCMRRAPAVDLRGFPEVEGGTCSRPFIRGQHSCSRKGDPQINMRKIMPSTSCDHVLRSLRLVVRPSSFRRAGPVSPRLLSLSPDPAAMQDKKMHATCKTDCHIPFRSKEGQERKAHICSAINQ